MSLTLVGRDVHHDRRSDDARMGLPPEASLLSEMPLPQAGRHRILPARPLSTLPLAIGSGARRIPQADAGVWWIWGRLWGASDDAEPHGDQAIV
jgi:hypothetical protein